MYINLLKVKQEQPSLILNTELQGLQQDAISLLKKLIATPSFSKEEDITADIIEDFLESKKIKTQRHLQFLLLWSYDSPMESLIRSLLIFPVG